MKSILFYERQPLASIGMRNFLKMNFNEYAIIETSTVPDLLLALDNSNISLVILGVDQWTNVANFRTTHLQKCPWFVYYSHEFLLESIGFLTYDVEGCMSKRCTNNELLKGIKMVVNGELYRCNMTRLITYMTGVSTISELN